MQLTSLRWWFGLTPAQVARKEALEEKRAAHKARKKEKKRTWFIFWW